MSRAFRHLTFSAKSEPGLKRKNNEDSFGAFPSHGVWCVADGMGGGDDGEIASAEVVQKVEEFCRAHPFPRGGCFAGTEVADGLMQAVNSASGWIFDRAKAKNLKGCGSTFVAVVFDASHPDRAVALHVGDSRLYRIRGRSIKQITKDHSAAELVGVKRDADLNPMFRGMILRAVGILRNVEVEMTPSSVKKDDRILICSDGLSKMVPDEKIVSIVNSAEESVEQAVDALIAAAYEAGASDNVTVEVVRVGELPSPVMAFPLGSLHSERGPSEADDTSGDSADTLNSPSNSDGDESDTIGTLAFEETSDDSSESTDGTEEVVVPARVASRVPRGWLLGVATGVVMTVLGVALVEVMRGCSRPPEKVDPPPAPSAVTNPPSVPPSVPSASPSAPPPATPATNDAPRPIPGTPSTVPVAKVPQPAERQEPVATVPEPKPSAASKDSPEEREREALSARLKAEREKMRRDEEVAAVAAEENHAAAVALGALCRKGAVLGQFEKKIKASGASFASLRSCAQRLASMRPQDNGFDGAACDLVRELQKLASSSNAGVRAVFRASAADDFVQLDPTSLAAYNLAAKLIETIATQGGGDG